VSPLPPFDKTVAMDPTHTGSFVRLEPLERRHIEGLVAAAAADPRLYQWSLVPQGRAGVGAYVETAIAWRQAGTATPFAIRRLEDDCVIGTTRFFEETSWSWPVGHPRHGSTAPDVCEIGYTWLARSAIRTAANTESKLLMLTHAFESWNSLGVCLHTDARNERSRAAMERIGAQFEGILRAHRLAVDATPRDSARYSITAPQWPLVKARLAQLLQRRS
jgi:RimJ/RimL family protein N-acetyltransferase